AIAKVCRKLQIPLPGRGYWAKKQHGHSVERTPLPELKDPPHLEKPCPPLKAKASEPKEDQTQFEQIDHLLASGAFTLPVDSKTLEHSLVRAADKAFQNAKEDNRHILCPPYKESCLDIRISRKSLDRALSIAG